MSRRDKKEIRDFARVLYAYLKEHCVGREISTSELAYNVAKQDDSGSFIFSEEELWDVDEALSAIVAQGHKYVMDRDRYVNQVVGLPYNIPFIFRLRADKHECWDGLVPFFKSGRSYLKWLREGYHEGDAEGVFFGYFRGLRQAVDPMSYDLSISEKDMCKALMRSQVTGELIDVVPDAEFLPGGEREGQLDGWTYHLEFVSHEEYFKRNPVEEE